MSVRSKYHCSLVTHTSYNEAIQKECVSGRYYTFHTYIHLYFAVDTNNCKI